MAQVAVKIPKAESLWARCSPEPNTGCWLWIGYVGDDGYPAIATRFKPMRAHRAAWMVTHGPIQEGLVVCHKCDQPLCINPAHLFLGTPADNTRDMVAKGRKPHGEKAPNARLTDAKVLDMRRRYAAGERQRDLATAFGVGQANVHYVVTGKYWAHLGEIPPRRRGGARRGQPSGRKRL